MSEIMDSTTSEERIRTALERIAGGASLQRAEASCVMADVAAGEVGATQLAALLMGLRVKGESVEEIAGFADAMRAHSVAVTAPHDAIDTCGTGGDGSGTFNVSTVAAFVAAGAGAVVAKHGNRAMSSSCGSADVLEALGATLELPPHQVESLFASVGFGFMFAPAYHPAMRHVAGVRRDLRVRTVFNVLGPLLNPAGVRRQILGVARPGLAPRMANVLRELGTERALVVHGLDGTDELSLGAATQVWELRDGQLRSYELTPEDVGLPRAPLSALRGGDRETNADIARAVLSGTTGPHRDVVAFNAGAAIYIAGKSDTLAAGVRRAEEVIDSGAARERLAAFVSATSEAAAEMQA